jgi:hypothetical protein
MNLKCLTADLGFAAGTVLPATSIDAGTVRNYINWGLLEETSEAPVSAAIQEPTAQEVAANVATFPEELSHEELDKLTDPNADH